MQAVGLGIAVQVCEDHGSVRGDPLANHLHVVEPHVLGPAAFRVGAVYHQDLAAYIQSTQRHVTGTVRVRLHKGHATAVGTQSPRSLYAVSLATYEKGDEYDQSAAEGFIKVWGLPVRVQAQQQLLAEPGDTLRIAAPDGES